MPDGSPAPSWAIRHDALPGSLLWLGVGLLAVVPAPLLPIARLYHARPRDEQRGPREGPPHQRPISASSLGSAAGGPP